jgi:nucleoside-triphosphatase THEP1
MLFLINKSPVYVWAIATILVILVWTQRYKRGMRQLSKPSFWIFFVIITMVAAFVITSIQMDKGSWEQGLIVGLQMNFRAAIVIVGFTVLGTELYNPKIRSYFAKTSFKQLPIAMELAFESLPVMISSLPNVKNFFKKPEVVFKNLIYQAEKRFNEIHENSKKTVFIITGDIAQGKTTFTTKLISFLQEKNIKTGGLCAPKIRNEENTVGYDIVNISSGERLEFLREYKPSETTSIGKFKVNSASLEAGKQWLNPNKLYDKELVIIDEVGKWELNNLGWADNLDELTKTSNTAFLLVIRESFVSDVISKWNFQNVIIFNVNDVKVNNTGEKIMEILKNS